MSDSDPAGGLFELGRQGLRAEDEGLRDLCDKFEIDHSRPEAWRNLALVMARNYVPGFPNQKQLSPQALAKYLRGRKSNAGRKPWPRKMREALLGHVDYWKKTQQRTGGPKRTDKEALKSFLSDWQILATCFPDMAKDDLPQLRRLMNIVSRTRTEQKKRALVAELTRRSRK